MFAPYAPAPACPSGTPSTVCVLIPLILALLFALPAGVRAGSSWDRESGKRKERVLPPIPQVREKVDETATYSPTASRPAPVVAMLDFNTTTLSPELQDAFAQALWAEFYQSPATRVLPRKELRRYLFAWDLYPHQPVGRQVSVAQTADALRADYLIHGHINRADGATMLDYQVYSSRLGGIVTKNNDIRTGSLRDMALLIPDLAQAMLAAIDYAEDQATPSLTNISADRTQLLAEQESHPGLGVENGEDEVSIKRDETPADPRAAAAAAERERARRLEEAHREALDDETEVAETLKKEEKVEISERESPIRTPIEVSPPHGPRPTELSMVSPSAELAPVKASREASPSKMRVNLQPVRQGDSSAAADSVPSKDDGERATGEPAESLPEESSITLQAPDTPIDLTSRDAAREAYAKSRTLPPEDSVARIGLLEQAVVLDPTEVDYAKALALAYYKTGRYKDCIEASRKAAELTPGDSIIHTILGSAFFESGRFEEARKAHTRSLELDSSNLYGRFNLALTLQALGSPRALAAWSEFLELSEDVGAQAQNRERALQYYDDLKAATR